MTAAIDITLPGIPAPARPRELTEEQKLEVAREIARELGLADDEEKTAAAIAAVARPHIDGYELARELEDRHGWSPDTAMVEILDGYSSSYSFALRQAQNAWATAHRIEPPLPVGTRVRVLRPSHLGQGTIAAVYALEPATFLVKVDGRDQPPSYNGHLVFFEDVEPLPEGEAVEP